MDIFSQLGVNHTFWMQLGIFIIVLFLLQNIGFKLYAQALSDREKRTLGNEDLATELKEQAKEVYQRYEVAARSLNTDIKNLFDESRKQAQSQTEEQLQVVRREVQKLSDETKRTVAQEVQVAKKKINEDLPLLANEISQKLMFTKERVHQ